MKKINILVNDTILTEFIVDANSNESYISRELYERIHFMNPSSMDEDGLCKNIPSVPIVTLSLSIEKKRIPAYLVGRTDYGYANIIGNDQPELMRQLESMCSEEEPVLNDNLTDAMARIAFYHKNHHGKLSYNENVFFADLDTIITFAEHLLKMGEYEKVISLLTVLNEFIERKLNRDKKYSEQMGAFLSARFFHTYGMALHRQNRYHEAYYYLLSAETIYTLNSPIGYKLYEMITNYPY